MSGVSGQCRLTTSALARSRDEVVTASGEPHARAERLGELGDAAADPSRPDDQELLPLEALADHEVRPPLPLVAPSQRAIALADPTQQGEDEPDRMLGGRVREHTGRVADDHSPLARRVEVDVVDPHRVVRDDAELRPGGVEVRSIDPDRRCHDDSLRVARQVDEVEGARELLLDLGGHARRLADTRPRHRAQSSSTRGLCDDE